MNRRFSISLSVFGLVPAALSLTLPVAAQSPSSAAKVSRTSAKTWTPARTADAQPDLTGIWSNATLTPLERPAELAGKETLTEQEADAFVKQTIQRNNADRRDGGADADIGRAYNEAWYDRGTKVIGDRRTSLIVDPPDGKVPALTPEAQKRLADARQTAALHAFDGPENRPLTERCITRGLPMLPGPYNNNFQIMQSPGFVTILIEAEHDVRTIPVDGRPHLPQNVRMWLGDSRGHWEGNTLVVDTTNFTSKSNFRGSSENLHLVERFTRTGPETMTYKVTVEDPTTFTKPWTADIPMSKTAGPIFEMACHEGNYAMTGILGGARAEEKKAAEEAAKKGTR
jgi:hypothetical protein